APTTQPSDVPKPAQSPLQKIGGVARTVGNKVAAGIEDVAAGTDPQFQVDPQTGVAKQIARVPTRNLFKSILAVALSGLSGAGAGAEAIAENPRAANSPASAIGVGARAGILEQYNKSQVARKQAQDDFENSQKQILFKAQVAAANVSTMAHY